MADHLVQVPCETCLYLVKRSEAPSLEENNRHDIKMIHKNTQPRKRANENQN